MNPAKAVLSAVASMLLFGHAPVHPGHPDDLARLFPKEVAVYAEVGGLAQLQREWKPHLASFLPEAKRKEALEELEKAAKSGFDRIPQRLLKDLERGLPTMQRLAMVLTMGEEGTAFSAAALSSDPAVFPRIVNEDLKVFASLERPHGDVTVLEIRKVGEVELGASLLVAAAGARLFLSSRWSAMTAMLDRAAKPAAAGDLREHPSYRALAALPEDAPTFRGFLGEFTSLFPFMAGGFGIGGRSSAHSLDQMNAVLGLDQLSGLSVTATLRPGDVRASTRMGIGSPCPLYDVWRQPAGPKELLKLLPASTAFAMHANLRSGADLWTRIKKLILRAGEIDRLAKGPDAPNEDLLAEFSQEFADNLGMTPDDLFGAVGSELMFALVGEEVFGGERQVFQSLVFGIRASDAAAARTLLDRLSGKLGEYAPQDREDVRWYLPKQEGQDLPVVALKGDLCLLGMAKAPLLALLKPAGAEAGLVSRLPADALASSKLMSFDFGAAWRGVIPTLGPEVPAAVRDLEISARTILFTDERDDAVLVNTRDSGLGLLLQAGSLAMPATMLLAFGALGLEDLPLATPQPEPDPSPAPLPADRLAERVKTLVTTLSSDDLEARESAGEGLRELGAQAVPAVTAALKTAADAEVRSRLLGLLLDWKAYDAAPEVLARKVAAFVDGFARAADEDEGGGDLVQWFREDGSTWTYALEPMYVDHARIDALPHLDVLDIPQGAAQVVAAAVDENLPKDQRRRLASVLAYRRSPAAGAAVAAALSGTVDPDVRLYLQIAAGWSDGPGARAAVLAGLKGEDPWLRRASFIAAERNAGPETVAHLVGLLKSPSPELRWNAAYTLRRISKDALKVNVYGSPSEIEKAAAWWKERREADGKDR
jgi:HEAT repeat protein